MNLIEDLQKVIVRVTEIKRIYDEDTGGAGRLAAALMDGHIKMSIKAILYQDTIKMMQMLARLREYEL